MNNCTCFWDLHWQILSLLKTKGECGIFFNFRLKITFWAFLLEWGLKVIFHWNAQLLTLFKSLFTSFAEVFMSWATLKRDVSSANDFALEDKSSDKSFVSIKNSNGPRMEHWRKPALTFSHVGFWPLRTKNHSKNQIECLAGYQIYLFVTV